MKLRQVLPQQVIFNGFFGFMRIPVYSSLLCLFWSVLDIKMAQYPTGFWVQWGCCFKDRSRAKTLPPSSLIFLHPPSRLLSPPLGHPFSRYLDLRPGRRRGLWGTREFLKNGTRLDFWSRIFRFSFAPPKIEPPASANQRNISFKANRAFKVLGLNCR